MDFKNRTRYYLKQGGVCLWLAVTLMILSAVARIIFYVGDFKNLDELTKKAFVYLPLVAALVYVIFVSLAAHRHLWLTLIPVYMGIAFFVIRAVVELAWWHAVLCCILYLIIAALFTVTVLGVLKTKWWLVLALALPLVYHLVVEDFQLLAKNPVKLTYSQWMPELSVLLIIASLMFLAIGMKKQSPTPAVKAPSAQSVPAKAPPVAAAPVPVAVSAPAESQSANPNPQS